MDAGDHELVKSILKSVRVCVCVYVCMCVCFGKFNSPDGQAESAGSCSPIV